MPAHVPPDSKTITADQATLLLTVVETLPSLKAHEWNEIAGKLGIANGKAAKERWRYLCNALSGVGSKSGRPGQKANIAGRVQGPALSIASVPTRKRTSSSRDGEDAATPEAFPVNKRPRTAMPSKPNAYIKDDDGEQYEVLGITKPTQPQPIFEQPQQQMMTQQQPTDLFALKASIDGGLSAEYPELTYPTHVPANFSSPFEELNSHVSESDFSFFDQPYRQYRQ